MGIYFRVIMPIIMVFSGLFTGLQVNAMFGGCGARFGARFARLANARFANRVLSRTQPSMARFYSTQAPKATCFAKIGSGMRRVWRLVPGKLFLSAGGGIYGYYRFFVKDGLLGLKRKMNNLERGQVQNKAATDEVDKKVTTIDGKVTVIDRKVTVNGKKLDEINVKVAKNGELIVKNGTLIIKNGELIVKNGTLIVANGKKLDGIGFKVTKNGGLIVKNGTLITANGKKIKDIKVKVADNGTLIVKNGKLISANGKKISVIKVKVADNGTLITANGKKIDRLNVKIDEIYRKVKVIKWVTEKTLDELQENQKAHYKEDRRFKEAQNEKIDKYIEEASLSKKFKDGVKTTTETGVAIFKKGQARLKSWKEKKTDI